MPTDPRAGPGETTAVDDASGAVPQADPPGVAGVLRTGTNDPETLVGGDGNDTLEGLGGDDSLVGEDGDESLVGGEGADTLEGGAGAGADALPSADGTDTLDGGDGDDLLRLGSIGAGLLVDGRGDVDTVLLLSPVSEPVVLAEAGPFGGARLGGIDAFLGSSGDDDVTADMTGPATLHGNDGNDTLTGGDGDDRMTGSAGLYVLSDGPGRGSPPGRRRRRHPVGRRGRGPLLPNGLRTLGGDGLPSATPKLSPR